MRYFKSLLLILMSFGLSSTFIANINGRKAMFCETSCENETITKSIRNVKGTIFIHFNDIKHKDTVFAIRVEGLGVLVPCNLPNNFKLEQSVVSLSGNIKSCCNLLTKPNYRTSFGCKLEISGIEFFKNE